MAVAPAQKRTMSISRAGSITETDAPEDAATMDGYVMRALAGSASVSWLCKKCSLGTSQTLTDQISEHPEFGAARGCRPPSQNQCPERLVWRERSNHHIAN